MVPPLLMPTKYKCLLFSFAVGSGRELLLEKNVCL